VPNAAAAAHADAHNAGRNPKPDGIVPEAAVYRSGKDYAALLAFAVKMRRFGPFNAILLHRLGLSFTASAPQWRAEWKRTVKEDARPLVVLRRFGPVG